MRSLTICQLLKILFSNSNSINRNYSRIISYRGISCTGASQLGAASGNTGPSRASQLLYSGFKGVYFSSCARQRQPGTAQGTGASQKAILEIQRGWAPQLEGTAQKVEKRDFFKFYCILEITRKMTGRNTKHSAHHSKSSQNQVGKVRWS